MNAKFSKLSNSINYLLYLKMRRGRSIETKVRIILSQGKLLAGRWDRMVAYSDRIFESSNFSSVYIRRRGEDECHLINRRQEILKASGIDKFSDENLVWIDLIILRF